jgi:hypothetical protein
MKPTVAKSEKTERPTATDTLVSISELVLKFRGEEKPNLATVARVANRASGLLRLKDLDEKMEVENAATIQIAKKHGLMS